MDEAEEAIEATQPDDVLARLLSLLGELDPSALVLNVVTVAEWLEPDGSPTLSVIGTPMAPWHVKGLLQEVLDDIAMQSAVHNFAPVDLDDTDEDDF